MKKKELFNNRYNKKKYEESKKYVKYCEDWFFKISEIDCLMRNKYPIGYIISTAQIPYLEVYGYFYHRGCPGIKVINIITGRKETRLVTSLKL